MIHGKSRYSTPISLLQVRFEIPKESVIEPLQKRKRSTNEKVDIILVFDGINGYIFFSRPKSV